MKSFETLEVTFYILMIFFGAFLPVVSTAFLLAELELGYTQLNTSLAVLPGFFVGAFMILFSLNKLGRILL